MKKNKKAWIVTVDMGYGHERAAYALRHLASKGEIIVANNYPGIPRHDRQIWEKSREFYETVSRLKPVPIIGNIIFEAMDKLQEIPSFYPRRDLSHPTLQLRQMHALIRTYEYGRDLIEKLRHHPLPFISTFFLPAFFAEAYDYPGEIYCVICDADISRTWAGYDPRQSRIKFFAPNGRVMERLRLYGVRHENIFLTGFPLPKENIGSLSANIVKTDLARRISILDPNNYFFNHYKNTLSEHLEARYCKKCSAISRRPLNLTFSVGGAGAQKKLGVQIVISLREKIRRGQIIVQLVAGARTEVAKFFQTELRAAGFKQELHSQQIRIFHFPNRREYFLHFPKIIRNTDILWTKPSELSFYTGLGLPIIMAPPIGSQEEFNRYWLIQIGGGVDQLDPKHTAEWLFDWVNSGGLARMAWNGFIEAPTHGIFRIEEVITGQKVELPSLPLIV